MNLDEEFDAARRRIALKIDYSARVAIGRIDGIPKKKVEAQLLKEAAWRMQAVLADMGGALSEFGKHAARTTIHLPVLYGALKPPSAPVVVVGVE